MKTQHQIESEISEALPSEEARAYWRGFGWEMRGEIRDIYHADGVTAAAKAVEELLASDNT